MGTDISDDDEVPESRVCVHEMCGADTIVSGSDFRLLSDPLSVADRTYCAHCEEHFPLTEFRWAETRERISEYRERYQALLPRTGRLLVGTSGRLLPILGGAVLGITLVLAQVPLVGTPASRALAGAGGLLGAFTGMWIQVKAIEPAVYRRAFGSSDPRTLA